MGATDIVAETLVIFCNFPSRDRYLETTCYPELGVRLLEAGGAGPGDGGQPPQLAVGQLHKICFMSTITNSLFEVTIPTLRSQWRQALDRPAAWGPCCCQ